MGRVVFGERSANYKGSTRLDWEPIETVLLDMDGTLLDLHYDNYFWLHHLPQRYADCSGRELEVCRRELTSTYDRIRGTLDWYCLDYWAQRLDLDMVALKQEVAHKIQLRPAADRFLQWLNQSGKRVLLVTNAHPEVLALKMAHIPIEHHFEAMVTSHQFRAPKEEAHFWQALHTQHPFDPERTLFIDDTEAVLRSAEAFGVAHLLGVRQPDMQGPVKAPGDYPAFHHFDEILED